MRRLVLLGALATACGGGSSADPALCDAFATAITDAKAKVTGGSCAASLYTPPALGLSVDTCKATIGKCTDADAQHLKDTTDCLNTLPTCVSPASWGPAYDACAAKIGPLAGQGC